MSRWRGNAPLPTSNRLQLGEGSYAPLYPFGWTASRSPSAA